jgi:hypothetical protein
MFASGQVSAREAVLVEPCTLIATASDGLDAEYGLLPVMNGIHMTNAGGIEAMFFGYLQPATVVFGSSTAGDFYVQARCLEPLIQCQSGTVDRRRIAQWRFSLGQYLANTLRMFRQKLLYGQIPLTLITGTAGQGEIAYPVTAPFTAGMNVVDFERDVFRSAVGAFPPPPLQQIFSQLVASQGTLLILDTGDFGVLPGLCVKPY